MLTAAQKLFADTYLTNGNNGANAYRLAYRDAEKENGIKASVSRLLSDANVQAYIREQQAIVKAQTTAILQQQAEERAYLIISKAERAEILSQIANGELPEKRHYVVKVDGEAQVKTLSVPAKHADRIRAINELNRMYGDHAAERHEHRFGALEDMPNAELEKRLEIQEAQFRMLNAGTDEIQPDTIPDNGQEQA